MHIRRVVSNIVEFALLALVLSLLLSAILGQPFLLGYVETDSMEPTLEPDDGFLAVPTLLSGDIDQGDVVVFQPEVINDGELVTHRVVGETENGFITKGDANPIPDQSGSGELPVKRQQIVATALQWNGNVVRLPALGVLITGIGTVIEDIQLELAGLFQTRLFLGTQGIAIVFALFFLSLYVVDSLGAAFASSTRDRDRDRERSTGSNPRLVVLLLTLFLIGSITMGMVGPSETHEIETIQSESETATFTIHNNAFVPTVVFLEPGSEKLDVEPRRLIIRSKSTAEARTTIHPPTGIHDMRRFMTEYHYLRLLPVETIQTLYHFHPWLPLVVMDVLVGLPFYLFGTWLIGTHRLRNRKRTVTRSVTTRVAGIFK